MLRLKRKTDPGRLTPEQKMRLDLFDIYGGDIDRTQVAWAAYIHQQSPSAAQDGPTSAGNEGVGGR